MIGTSRLPGTDSERGVVVPIVGLVIVALLTLTAIVIDLGSTRTLRGSARSAADSGSTAGALALVPSSSSAACADAFAYTYLALGATQPDPSTISAACSTASMGSACSPANPDRTASLMIGGVTVSVTNPVGDSSQLLRASAVGGGVAQPAFALADGTSCQRVGVTVSQAQSRYFSGVAGINPSTFAVHSVARYTPNGPVAVIPPALVALNQTACGAIDAGSNGSIIVTATATGPGVAYSDSDGSSCVSQPPILASGGSARLVAEAFAAVPGQLAWYNATDAKGYGGNPASDTVVGDRFSATPYVGQLYARSARTTRVPLDRVYHCQHVPVSAIDPICSTPDSIAAATTYAAAPSAPVGFTPWTGPCTTTGGPVTLGAAGANIWVNCPTFQVKGSPLVIAGGGTIIFTGAVSVEAGGFLAVNATAAIEPDGTPTPVDASLQTTLVIADTGASAFSVSSASASVAMAQTTIVSRGGFNLQSGPAIRWTAPTASPTQGLLYWSESTNRFSLQGGPTIGARGTVFQGNGTLYAAGNGNIDLTHVQMWVDSVLLSGGPRVLLAPDPTYSVKTASAGTRLVR